MAPVEPGFWLGSPSGLHTGSEQCTAHSNKPTAKPKLTKRQNANAANNTMTTEAKPREDDAHAAGLGVALPAATPEERRAVKFVGLTGLVLSVVTTPLYGWVFSRGVCLGAGLAVANLLLTAQSVRAFLGGNVGPAETRTGASWGTFVVFKLLVLSFATYLLLHYGLVQGFALIVGLAALPVGIVCLQLAGPLKPPRP